MNRFNHDLWKNSELLEVKEENDRRYYKLPSGIYVPSVTTKIGELKRPIIEAWRKRVGLVEATKITQQALTRGSAVHDLCEKYLMNRDDYKIGHQPNNIFTFLQLKTYLDKYVSTVYAIEYQLYSEYLKTAGRTDLIADFNGVKSIVDFKTSTREKTEDMIEGYFLQATCYAMMVYERLGVKIPQIVIMITNDQAVNANVFVKDTKDYVKKVIEIFK